MQDVQLMDGGTWIYIIGGIIYLVYSAVQAAKKKKEEAAAEPGKPRPRTKLSDVFEEMMKEMDTHSFPTKLPKEETKTAEGPAPTQLPKAPTHFPRNTSGLPRTATHIPQNRSDLPKNVTHLPRHRSKLPEHTTHLPQHKSQLPGKKKHKAVIESTEASGTLETITSYETGETVKKPELKDNLKSYVVDPVFVFDPRQAIIYSEIMRRPYP